MPAYFGISMQFQRKALYPCFVQDFYSALFDAGMRFCSGYWESEEIVVWNQKRLEQNFVLGYDQHVKHDYKQMSYNFADFSEVRGYWMNEEPEEGVFSYELIVPESEVFAGYRRIIPEGNKGEEYVWSFKRERINMLLELSKNIWRFPYVKAIQTKLELDEATELGELEKGETPSIRPFAILEKNKCSLDEKDYFVSEVPGRKGICIQMRGLEI